MHSENDNIEIMINEKADEVIEELFNNFFLDIKLCWKGNDFVFDCVHLLYCECHKMNLNCGGSCIESS